MFLVVKRICLLSLLTLFTNLLSAQITVGFQGGEPGDTWTYTSTGADATALNERTLAPNKVSGTVSLVVGGNTTGGSCISGGSGNGPDTPRTFTFDALDISSSSNFVRTFTVNWGNRFPVCVGTGWDSGEDLIFTAFHDNIAQPSVTLANGNNNAAFSIATHQYTWSIPACVNSFRFTISVTTNRRDELLFIDNAKVTAPSLNAPTPATSAITGNTDVCIGSSQTLSVTQIANTSYTWSGLPSGATFTTPNGTTSSNSIGIDWGTAAPGTYTISVIPSLIVCGLPTPGPATTIDITVNATPQLTVSPDATICPGQSTTITASGATTYSWDNGLGSGSSFSVSPATTTTYTVTGSTGNCTSTASVTVTVAPNPTVTITANPTTICSGSSATLTASGATTYTWQPATGLNATTGATVTANPTTTYTYTVEGNDGTCTGTATQTITVTPLPQLTVSPDITICQGQSTTISVSGAITYSWDNGLGAGSSFTVNPTTTTTYNVTGSNGNCSSTASVTVTVVPSITVTAAASPASVCPSGTSTLTASGATNYTWQPATGLSSTTGSTVTAAPTATTTYTVTGTTGTCTSTASVTVSMAPALNISVSAAPASVCAGGTTTLTASGATSYSWQPTPGLSSTTGAVVNATLTVTTTYTVTGTTGTCQGTGSVTVTVNSAAAISAGNDITVCEGNTVTLSGSGGTTYAWDNGVTDGVAFAPNTSAIYTVVGTTADGCVGTDQVNVTVESAPTAAFQSDVQSGCLPLAIQFANASTGVTTYNWDFGDGTTSTDQDPAHTYYYSGCKNVTLQVASANGCSRTLSMPNYICIQASPVAAFSVNPGELSESNPQANFINASENAVSYVWNFGDNTTSTEESPEHTFAVIEGGYEVTLYAYNADGCMDSTKSMILFNESPVYYVPNAFTPDGNEMNQTFQPVFTAGFDPQRFHLEIYNRWGERIFESNDPKIGWDGTSWNGTMVPDGTYIWKIGFNLKNSDDKRIIKGHVVLVR